MSSNLQAKVTAYKGIIAIELIATKSAKDVCTISLDNPNVIGQVIHNTKEHLGVSDEAVALLKTVPRGRDSMGDVVWFTSNDGHANFAWIGGPFRLVNPIDAEGSRDFRIQAGHYVTIPNDTPEGARQAIDASIG